MTGDVSVRVCVCAGVGKMERGEEGQLQLEETMEAKTWLKGHGGQERERGEARRGASVVVPSRACVRGARREEIRIWAVVSRRGRHRAPRSREARQARELLLGHQHTPIASISGIPAPPRTRTAGGRLLGKVRARGSCKPKAVEQDLAAFEGVRRHLTYLVLVPSPLRSRNFIFRMRFSKWPSNNKTKWRTRSPRALVLIAISSC